MSELTLGIMLDCSRNAVMKPEKVKEFAKIIADMGYNMLQLYTEDTYEIKDEPFFGHMRGRYSQEEIFSFHSTISYNPIIKYTMIGHTFPFVLFCYLKGTHLFLYNT